MRSRLRVRTARVVAVVAIAASALLAPASAVVADQWCVRVWYGDTEVRQCVPAP